MKRLSVICAALTVSLSVFSTENNSATLLTIGGKPVTVGEFDYIFSKNNTDSVITKQKIDEYMKLFVNFKLKVLEAENRGMDTTTSFVNELKTYRDQLAEPYMTDREIDEELMKMAYERITHEVSASHILIRFQEGNPDTTAAYNKIMAILARIKKGENFEKLASETSEDTYSAKNGGKLGYFKGFQMIKPFEDACYENKVGDIVGPVKTIYGYHLIKINDLRPSSGDVRVAHILKLVDQDAPAEAWNEANEKINNIRQQLADGADFTKLAAENSDDQATAENGGELSWFGVGEVVPEFLQAAFALKNPGDISSPVKTMYGFHIIKLLEKRPVRSMAEMRDEIKSSLSRSPLGGKSKEVFYAKRKAEYNYTENKAMFDKLVEISHQYTYRDSMFKVVTRGMNEPIFTLDGKVWTVENFADYLVANPRGETPDETERVRLKLDRYSRQEIDIYEKSQLERKYPEFRYLMNEYHDGILLFDISQKEIWNKASEDEKGLIAFHNKIKKNYKWEEPHFAGKIYFCETDSAKGLAQKLLKKGTEKQMLDSINKLGPVIRIEEGIYKQKDNNSVDALVWGLKPFEPFMQYKAAFVVGKAYKVGAPKELSLVRGSVISDYQNYLEKAWLKKLAKKYPVKINKKVINQIKIK